MEGFVIFTIVPTDGYRVARFLVAFGTTIKVLAVIAAAMLFWEFSVYGPEFRVPTSIIAAGLEWAAVVGFAGFVVGVFVSANGQQLKASLDYSVNPSPFFSIQQQAQIVSIPVDYKPTPPDASPSPSATATVKIRCPKCGSTNVARAGEGFSLFERRGCGDCGHKWS